MRDEETLILFYYGELDEAEADALRARLVTDDALAAQFAALTAELDGALDLPVPERDAQYGRRVWARVDAALDEDSRRGFAWPGLGFLARPGFQWVGAALVLGMVALMSFQMGRMTPPVPETSVVATTPADNDYQARLLQASLTEHFDGAERLLLELSNGNTTAVDLEAEKNWAKTLLVANRLYRYAAEQAGQHRIAMLLGDMEPVLIELANGSGQLTPDEYRVLRRSIAERDLIYKVRSTNLSLQPQSATL